MAVYRVLWYLYILKFRIVNINYRRTDMELA